VAQAVDLVKIGAKITGGNGIPAGSGSVVDTSGGVRKDLGSSRAYFAEFGIKFDNLERRQGVSGPFGQAGVVMHGRTAIPPVSGA